MFTTAVLKSELLGSTQAVSVGGGGGQCETIGKSEEVEG
jgi:hypothetical protein